MAQKKYVSLTRLENFLDNIRAKFAFKEHQHTLSDVTDYTVDNALSSTSTNPVQNKVVNAEFDAIADAMGALDLAIDGKSDSSHKHDSDYDTKGSASAALEEAKSYADSAANEVKNDLLNGAGDAYDTLKELGDLIDTNVDAIEALETIATTKFDVITNKLDTIEEGAQANVQSDWSVNDPENSAYVKNRTHWVGSPQQATLFESQDVDFEHDPDYNLTSTSITLTQNVKDGDAITFVFDGTQYDITLQQSLRFGNMSILGIGEDTGESFLCIMHENECEIYTADTADAIHTIEIYWITQEYHKLDRNYLPDDAVLPIIDEYDDGHTLVARNGEWITEQPAGIHFGYGGEIFNSYNGVYANEAGVDAHAEGYQTKALGQASHTSGQGTIASGVGQYVFGTYNIEDTSASTVELNPTRGKRKYVHIVGNGINEDSRSNAHTLDWSGNAWFAGDVKVGGTSQDDTNAKTLATTDDLSWNNLKDRPFYSDDNVTIYESTITTSDLGGMYGVIDQSDVAKTIPALIEGETYTITFDNDVYSCVCHYGIYLGNLSLLQAGDNTNEPFAVIVQTGFMFGVATTDTTSATHAIKIEGPFVKTLDEKYLPELPYVTMQEGNQYWVSKSAFAPTNSNLTYKGKSYMTNHEYFLFFLTDEGLWQISLVINSSAQIPSASNFRMNYASSDGTLSFYWRNESETTEITTAMHAYLHDVNTGNIIRRASNVQSVTIGAYTKKSHNVDFYINKSNPQDAKILRSFDDYVETYSQDEVDALIASIRPKSATVTIHAANWTGDANPWSQTVSINGVTENSKVDLQPTAQQIVALQDAEVSIMLQNDSGIITAWAIGKKPTVDYTFDVLITEVSVI